jgi:hypothetical protein
MPLSVLGVSEVMKRGFEGTLRGSEGPPADL